jgi:CRP-like cAMP-binding protein
MIFYTENSLIKPGSRILILALNPVHFHEIKQHYLFSPHPEESINTIFNHSGLISLDKKQHLFEYGSKANFFFLVRHGQISLSQTSSDGNEKIVNIFSSGQTFGEAMMFVEDEHYLTSARAITDSEVFYFDINVFKQQLCHSHESCCSLMMNMSKRVNDLTQEIIELSIYNAQYRLISYLLKNICKYEEHPVVVLSSTKSQLASRLSITPETFSRVLARLKKAQLIDLQEETIVLKEYNKLKELIAC